MFSMTTTPEKADDLEAQQNLTATTALTSPSSSVPHSRTSTFLAEDHPALSLQHPQAARLRVDNVDDEKRISSAAASTIAPSPDDADITYGEDEKKGIAKAEASPDPKGEEYISNTARPVASRPPPSISSTASSANSESPDLPHGHSGDKAFQVAWSGPDDPANPQNWTRRSRWYYTSLGSLLVFNATFASSSPGGIVQKVMADLGFGTEVALLMISLFLAGYCVGPLFWGPLSEIYGRKPIFVVSFLFYTGFQIGCALSPNTGAILGKPKPALSLLLIFLFNY